ncbi:MAG: ribonuclease P protein component 4 [Candidatus Micrarchaeia archaeon]
MQGNQRYIIKKIATERIAILYALAKDMALKNTEESRALSRSYTKRIMQISMHYKVKLPKKVKDNICKKCLSVLIPGLNTHVRISSSHSYIIKKCDNCGTEKHIFIKGKKVDLS